MPNYILRRKDENTGIADMVAAIEAVPSLRILNSMDVAMLVSGDRKDIDALPGIGDWMVFEEKRIPLPTTRPRVTRPPQP